MDVSPLADCPRLVSLTVLTDCQRRLEMKGIGSLDHLSYLSLSAHVRVFPRGVLEKVYVSKCSRGMPGGNHMIKSTFQCA